jgi:heme/copper-type cytochrome/quinol oxidase subunit 4
MLTRQEIQAHIKDHLQYVLIPKGLPLSYVIRIAFVDAIITVIGLSIWLTPLFAGFYPGAFDTTVHVALGALITALSFFRVTLAYLSAWVEIVLIALGILVLRIPHFMHMEWNSKYTMGHMAAGGAIIVLAAISGLMTWVQLKKQSTNH